MRLHITTIVDVLVAFVDVMRECHNMNAASFLVHAALAFQNTSDAGIANTDTLSYWTFSE